jgi:hypothetical protein
MGSASRLLSSRRQLTGGGPPPLGLGQTEVATAASARADQENHRHTPLSADDHLAQSHHSDSQRAPIHGSATGADGRKKIFAHGEGFKAYGHIASSPCGLWLRPEPL